MKAEHRKELQTNLLADRMGRLVQGVRSGPRSASLGVWVIGLLALATVVGWYYAKGQAGSQGRAWVQLDKTVDSNEDKDLATAGLNVEPTLDDVIRKYPGTLAARTARFQMARIHLNRGLKSLFGTSRSYAVTDLESARKLYQQLVAECQGDRVLEPEALMGAAKAEEALVGVPKKDEADSSLGDLDRALKWYDRLANSKEYKNTFLGQEAAKHAKELRDHRTEVAQFYAEINKLGAAKPAPAGLPPPTP